MIRDDDLVWMKAFQHELKDEKPSPRLHRQSSWTKMADAAAEAVKRVDAQRKCMAIEQLKEEEHKPMVAVLSPGPEPEWTELRGSSTAWQPATLLERRGHPAHSLLAFEACYDLQRKLASGGFGTVHLATRKRNGQSVAVKKVPMSSAIDEADLRRELDVMRKIDHPHVIRTMDAYWASEGGTSEGEKREIWLVAGYCAGGELFEWCKARTRTLREADHQRLSLELLRGLAYLHAHGVIHRDIKPSNLLMATPDQDASLRIADFGLCKWVRPVGGERGRLSCSGASGTMPGSAGQRRGSVTATPRQRHGRTIWSATQEQRLPIS